MKKKFSLLSFILILAVFALAACGSNNDGASGKDKDGKTTITYWSMWNTGEPQQEVLQGIIDAYEEENENVTIDVQWMGREVLSDVRNAAIGGDGPDLTEQSGAEVAGTLISNDIVEPLDDLLSMEIPGEGSTFSDVFIDDTLDFYKKDDHTYFIPYEIITSGFHYNEKLVEQHALYVPIK